MILIGKSKRCRNYMRDCVGLLIEGQEEANQEKGKHNEDDKDE